MKPQKCLVINFNKQHQLGAAAAEPAVASVVVVMVIVVASVTGMIVAVGQW